MTPRKRTALLLSVFSVAMMAVIAFWLVRDPHDFLHDMMGLTPQALHIPWAWALAAAFAVTYVLYTLYAVPFVNEHKFDFTRFRLYGVWIAPLSGIVEEIVFRRLLMDAAQSWGLPAGWQIVVSAAVFSATHSLWVLFSGDVRIALPVTLSTLGLGAMMATLYLVGDRNVLPAIAAHTLINLVIEPWLLLSAVSGRWVDTRPREQT